MSTLGAGKGNRKAAGASLGSIEAESTFSIYGSTIGVTAHTEKGRTLLEDGKLLRNGSGPVLASRARKRQDTVLNIGGGDRRWQDSRDCWTVRGGGRIPASRDCKGDKAGRGGHAARRRVEPRTSPYSFQGSGEPALRLLKRVGEELGMPVVSEIVSELHVGMFKDLGIDVAQIGAKNAQNYALISAVARAGIPMLLKRGPGSTVKEWLYAAEYALMNGNGNVMLCERGIRTFEDSTRYTLDIAGMASVQQMTHLPVGADPGHAAGRRELVPQLARAAAGGGAKFLLIEAHSDPKRAMSDADQQLDTHQFAEVVRMLRGRAERTVISGSRRPCRKLEPIVASPRAWPAFQSLRWRTAVRGPHPARPQSTPLCKLQRS